MKTPLRALCLTLLSALAFTCVAARAQAAHKLPEIKYQKYTLPNGLTVITHEDHRLPLVSVDLWYHVGPLNEKAGRTGFAHLFEHMMFEGSEHVGAKAHIRDVEAAGATDVNGTTDFDRTNYFETMPSNQLELALWLESDRMGFLMEGLDREKLINQKDVVRNERRQGEGRPYDVAEEEVYHQLFPKGHPYYGDVIGSHADIESTRIADVRDFHQQFYTPNNASIAIAGDFDPVKLKACLKSILGPFRAGPRLSRSPWLRRPSPRSAAPPLLTRSSFRGSQLRGSRRPPTRPMPTAFAARSTPWAWPRPAGSIRRSSTSRRLRRASIAMSNALKLTGIATCDITAKPGVKLEDLEATFWDELAKLQNDGPTAEEVESAKATALTRKISGLQRLGGFGGVADTLDQYNQYTGDPGFLTKDVQMTEDVTASQHQGRCAKIPHQGLGGGGLLRSRQESTRRRAAQPRRYRRRREARQSLHARIRSLAGLAQDQARARPSARDSSACSHRVHSPERPQGAAG